MATTFGVLGAVSRRYAHRIPFIVKINHNELLTYPNKFDQIMFGIGGAGLRPRRGRRRRDDLLRLRRVDAPDPGSRARRSRRPTSSACSRCCGATCATAPSRPSDADYHAAADLTGQANHIGVTIEADIIKQKLPTNNGGYNAFKGYGKTSKLVYDELTTDHPIDLCRWQVANCYMGRIGLINSGGESKGASDLAEAVRTAVINKRAGGMGLISGRKAFQRPMSEGVELPTTQVDGVVAREAVVHGGVRLAVALERVVAAVVRRQLLLDDVGFDRDADVVGLGRQVGRVVVVDCRPA